jgi:hypothetical protein
MKQTILTLVVLAISTFSLFAQIKATTEDGKKVILNDDKTWKYEIKVVAEETVNMECSELISTEKDKMTGKTSTSAKKTLIVSDDGGKSGFGIYLINGSSSSLIWSIQVAGAGGCIDDDNKMNVLFRDGTRLELVNNGEFNCESQFTLYFGGSFGKKKELEMLRTKEVETIRIWTSKNYVEKDFTSEQSKQLMKTVDCLLSN